MTDNSASRPRRVRAELQYPFETPAAGQTVEVAPGVRWVRMPMPYVLDHINLWLLDDGEDLTLVDTGERRDETLALWNTLLAGPEVAGRAIGRVIVTHMHPDHVGMAGWFTRRFDCRLWMSRLEYLTCRSLVSDTGREAPPDGQRFFRRAGWDDAAIEAYRARFGNYGRNIHALPDSFRRLVDGEEFRIGAHTWRVIIGRGHSPEHACLYCPELKVFITGDQVLPRISSNISVHPTEPDADPMAEWYESVARILAQVPDDVLVLPAHGNAFRGLHARLRELRDGQDVSLARLRERLREPRRAVDVFGSLFGRAIDPADPPLLSMATGEALACLNHLVARGEAQAELDAAGVNWYRLREAVPA